MVPTTSDNLPNLSNLRGSICKDQLEKVDLWGAWLAQLLAHVTLDFGVVVLSPTLGI